MLELIYTWSFVGALTSLLCWSFVRNLRLGVLFQFLFFVGIAFWATCLYLSPSDITMKAGIVLRDLMVLGIASGIMHWARSNMVSGVMVLMATGIFLRLSYLDVLKSSLITLTIEYADSELLVDLADVNLQDLEKVVAKYNGTVRRAFSVADGGITDLDEFYLIDLPGFARPHQIRKLTAELTQEGLIDWAEANEMVSLSPVETEINESIVISNKFVNDPDVNKQWSFQALDVADLHAVLSLKTVTPKKTALIAILDTGIDGKHEDLAGSYQSTQEKYDRDIQGHGTHLAGIAAAVSNNHIGIASFDPSHSFVRVTSIKVLSDLGFGSQADIVQGMLEAADLGADVISMSLGGRSNSERELTYEKAVKYCNDKGAVVVVAAGNASTNAKFYTPANVQGVIAVSAVDRSLQKTSFSNSVSEIKYGIAAPGDEIYSTFPKNQYRSLRGTSMACPHVASLVGILKSLNPDLNTAEIHQVLENTGRVGKQTKEAGNIIQPAAAIRALLD